MKNLKRLCRAPPSYIRCLCKEKTGLTGCAQDKVEGFSGYADLVAFLTDYTGYPQNISEERIKEWGAYTVPSSRFRSIKAKMGTQKRGVPEGR